MIFVEMKYIYESEITVLSIDMLCMCLHFCLVKAAVLEFPNVVGTEGESAVLRCRAIGDPEPQMTIRKISQTEPYELGSNVSLPSRFLLYEEQ